MNSLKRNLLLILIGLLFSTCKIESIPGENFIGIWRSKTGKKIEEPRGFSLFKSSADRFNWNYNRELISSGYHLTQIPDSSLIYSSLVVFKVINGFEIQLMDIGMKEEDLKENDYLNFIKPITYHATLNSLTLVGNNSDAKIILTLTENGELECLKDNQFEILIKVKNNNSELKPQYPPF